MKIVSYISSYEEAEILGSGSNRSSVFRTKSESEAIEDFKNSGFKNCLVKEVWEDGCITYFGYDWVKCEFRASV